METAARVMSSSKFRIYVDSTMKRQKKAMWKICQYFIDFESRINVDVSMSDRCPCLNVDSPFIKNRQTFDVEF